MSTESSTTERDQIKAAFRQAMKGTVGVNHPKPAVLDHAHQTAVDSVAQLTSGDGLDQEAFDAIAEDLPADLRAWLLELPSFLAKKSREAQGHDLCTRFAPLLGEAFVESERAIVYLEAGKKDEARAQLERCAEKFPDHRWMLLRRAFFHESVGDLKAAREDHERSIEKAREAEDRKDLRFAFDGYVQFLQNRGEQSKAVEVSRTMLEELPEIEEEFRTEQIVNDAPKVGRNDPCPCGSGKKFKKCHGAPGAGSAG